MSRPETHQSHEQVTEAMLERSKGVRRARFSAPRRPCLRPGNSEPGGARFEIPERNITLLIGPRKVLEWVQRRAEDPAHAWPSRDQEPIT